MSKAMQTLANQVKQSFNAYRVLTRKYSVNIELADPQLKNNEELVKVLQMFENTWSLAKDFFDNEEWLWQMNWFASLLQDKGKKY